MLDSVACHRPPSSAPHGACNRERARVTFSVVTRAQLPSACLPGLLNAMRPHGRCRLRQNYGRVTRVRGLNHPSFGSRCETVRCKLPVPPAAAWDAGIPGRFGQHCRSRPVAFGQFLSSAGCVAIASRRTVHEFEPDGEVERIETGRHSYPFMWAATIYKA